MKKLMLTFLLVLVAVFSALSLQAQDEDDEVQDKIENAMSAAPIAIAQNATILDNAFDENGDPIILREGTNEWTCFPALDETPSDDPVCFDPMWMVWWEALVSGTEPNITAPGFAYMLQGGSGASTTDPFLMEPAEGEDWKFSPPHVMVILPEPLDTDLFTTDPTLGGPWIMWAGTPYEHIMMPIELEEE